MAVGIGVAGREGHDPPRVSWQTEQLYRVEHARRALHAARQLELAMLAWHRRYEDEARQRAAAARAAWEERQRVVEAARAQRLAWEASLEGWAEAARHREALEKRDTADREWRHAEDLARRRYRMPVWAEWAAWQWSVGKKTQVVIGQEVGSVSASAVGVAIEDYLYLNMPEVDTSWHERCPLHFEGRKPRLRKHFKGVAEPPRPVPVVVDEEPAPATPRTPAGFRARNEWIYRQRVAGQNCKVIAKKLGLSKQRVNQICCSQQRVDWRRRQNWPKPKPWRAPRNPGRPVDMGGPRDVWLTYYPPPDPRLDNMEPVQA